jgi:formylglycine-generating enzyme
MDHQTAGATFGTAYFIPTEDEWYKAAFHKNNGVTGGAANYWNYSTGSDTYPTATTVANQLGVAPGSANYNSVIGSPTNVGAYNLKPSTGAYGTFDQSGNVWEWNETLISGVYRGSRGGSFGYYAAIMASSSRNTGNPTYEGYDTGFRVASVPEPGSITLLVCGAIVGLILWWRRK